MLCHAHHHLFGIRVACLRFFTVYGPRQRPEMAIHKFVDAIEQGRAIQQFGDGTTARDYTYVSDIVEGIVRAMERCASYHVWNLGGSRTITLAALVQAIAAGLGVEAQVEIQPPQPGDVERTWADVSRAQRELDWSATVTIEQGLERFIAWYREQPRAARIGRGG